MLENRKCFYTYNFTKQAILNFQATNYFIVKTFARIYYIMAANFS